MRAKNGVYTHKDAADFRKFKSFLQVEFALTGTRLYGITLGFLNGT